MKKQDLAALAAVAALYAALHFAGFGCPIKAVTGVSCAGCGMTRAWLAALAGDWAEAFFYHPLFWMVPPAVLVFFLRKRLPRRLVTVLAGRQASPLSRCISCGWRTRRTPWWCLPPRRGF